MKAVVMILVLLGSNAHAMSRMSSADLAAAREEAVTELRELQRDFHIAIRERIRETNVADDSDGSSLLAAEVETLPGAEVTEPWILAAPDATLNGLNREGIGALQSTELAPLDGTSDRRVAFGTK